MTFAISWWAGCWVVLVLAFIFGIPLHSTSVAFWGGCAFGAVSIAPIVLLEFRS